MLQEKNNSSDSLIVGSLTVLSDIKNSGIQTLQSTVAEMKNVQTTERQKQANYWSELSQDGKLTALEKKKLRTELNTELVAYQYIIDEATKSKCIDHADIKAYKAQFQRFKESLEKVYFINQDTTTDINAEQFDKLFADYYKAKETALDRIALAKAEESAERISIKNIDEKHEAIYLGKVTTFPPVMNYGKGDWFTWGGKTQVVSSGLVKGNKLIKGRVYRVMIQNGTWLWEEVTDDIGNARELTAALGDILNVSDTIEYGYFRNLYVAHIITRDIKMPLDSYIYAGNFNTGDVVTKVKDDKGNIIEYKIAESGIPKNKKGFILSGNGDAAFSGSFQGDFHSALFDVEKKTVSLIHYDKNTTGLDIFKVAKEILALSVDNKDYIKINKSLLFNGITYSSLEIKNLPNETHTFRKEEKRDYGDTDFSGTAITEVTVNTKIIQVQGYQFRYNTLTSKSWVDAKRYGGNLTGDWGAPPRVSVPNLYKNGYVITNSKGNITTLKEYEKNHIMTGSTKINISEEKTYMIFKNLPEKYYKNNPIGSLYTSAGFLMRTMAAQNWNFQQYNGGAYSLNYYTFPNGLLIHFGETQTVGDNGGTYIVFKKAYAFPPVVIAGAKDNNWSKAFARNVSKTGCEIAQQKDESRKDTSAPCYFFVIGQAAQ